ncbi:MAG: zinc ribbon domain-containing protein [Desulfatiglans sp.]|nr:zinc ribbon domain-containing protein [Desulfatiglans sp.]
MPVYEFYCSECHVIFNFLSARPNTDKRPLCPRCGKLELERHMSVFSISRNRSPEDDMPFPDMDESQMEKAMSLLAREAENIDENDPRQAVDLMRKLSDMTGLDLGPGMEEALSRMEAGEDPEKIEADMGDILEEEDPFSLKKRLAKVRKSSAPEVDDTLYEL